MSSSVTPQYLLEGAVYSLEQCGLLLNDAAILYQNDSYASAFALAALAREELGRWKILLELRKEAIGGKAFTLEDIDDHCGDHVRKQRAGMLSITMRTNRDTGLGTLLEERTKATPGSEERKAAEKTVAKLDQQKKKRVPDERHNERMAALYVDPISLSEWNRPTKAISQQSAHDFISDARNDYLGQFERYNNPGMYKVDAEHFAALEKWTAKPELPPRGPELDFPV
jgi:AbiV family abortive infection protein